VQAVEVRSCLHLKSACSYVGNDTVLINRAWVDAARFHGFQLLDVPVEERAAANALLINDVVIIPASFPKTRALLEKRGFRVQVINICELQKAEAGVTCGSLIFNHEGRRGDLSPIKKSPLRRIFSIDEQRDSCILCVPR